MLIFLIAVLSLIAQFFLPWWVIALIPFALSYWRPTSAGKAFLAGFGGIAMGWLLTSMFIHVRTEGILTSRIATLFTLPTSAWLVVVTVLISGVVGGIAALSGFWCRKAWE